MGNETLTCPDCHGTCSVSFWRWTGYNCPFCGPDYTVMDTFSANLALAGALCEAFRLGGDHRLAWYDRTVGYGLPNDKWHPGCGRPAKKGG